MLSTVKQKTVVFSFSKKHGFTLVEIIVACAVVIALFLFSVCCFRMGSFFFPSLYARANIIMCVSFSSGVLRYKNMLCNTSVIQSITKKFQEIRIIFPSYVCW